MKFICWEIKRSLPGYVCVPPSQPPFFTLPSGRGVLENPGGPGGAIPSVFPSSGPVAGRDFVTVCCVSEPLREEVH